MASRNALSRIRNVWRTFFPKKDSPRELLERNDLYKNMLASTYYKLRLEQIVGPAQDQLPQQHKPDEQKTSAFEKTSTPKNKSDLERLVEEASDVLDKELAVYDMPVKGLRFELQNILAPEIVRLLRTFEKVDLSIPIGNTQVEVNFCKSVLLEEYKKILSDERKVSEKQGDSANNSLKFAKRKKGAIETILSFNGWENQSYESSLDGNQIVSNKDKMNEEVDAPLVDDFGYDSSKSSYEVKEAMRFHQMLNLTKSILIRNELGYSVVSLQSSVPGAGRGIFVDGFAPAGSILAFFPGQIWPKEYLMNVGSNGIPSASSLFEHDPNFQLSLRYDDILIDSRKSSYTVLNDNNSNAFAIAHIANHPPKDVTPNCNTTMLNFTENMGISINKMYGNSGLEKYIPNTYARPPMLIGPKAFDREIIVMHGFGLLACRDICDEEVFYDYRLSPGAKGIYPEWYHICNEEELKNRWFHSFA